MKTNLNKLVLLASATAAILVLTGCASIPECDAFQSIARKPYDVTANNCQHKARAYAEVLTRAGYNVELVRVMTQTTAHMIVRVKDGEKAMWLDPTSGHKLADLQGWEYYRIGDGPVLPVTAELSSDEKRALEYCDAIGSGELDAELVSVHVGRKGNWKAVPEEKWANYAPARSANLVAGLSR